MKKSIWMKGLTLWWKMLWMMKLMRMMDHGVGRFYGWKHNLDEGTTVVDEGTGDLEDVGETEKKDLDEGLECN